MEIGKSVCVRVCTFVCVCVRMYVRHPFAVVVAVEVVVIDIPKCSAALHIDVYTIKEKEKKKTQGVLTS